MKILETVAKMKKEFPMKKDGKNTFFYDFSLINEYIPEDIRNIVIDKAINGKTSVLNPEARITVQDHEKGILYYIDIDFKPYNVYKNGKRVFGCLESYGMRIKGYKYNIYGTVYENDLPIINNEIGHMRKSVLVNIENIDF